MLKNFVQKNYFFVGILKFNYENRRIRIRIHNLQAWIRGSGFTPKCYGSATLVLDFIGLADPKHWLSSYRYPLYISCQFLLAAWSEKS
jgi:hypothetical protein